MASFDAGLFAQLVRRKRGEKNLRESAREIGDVSISTLSRIEQGKIPDLSTFLKVCTWLNVSPNQFAPDFKNNEENHKQQILYHLRADKTLSAEVSKALKQVIELSYANSDKLAEDIE